MAKACWCHLCDSRFGVWSGNATSLNFQFAKLSRIIHSPDQTPNMRQRHVGDIQFAKKFYDVHLPDQTPTLRFRTGHAKLHEHFGVWSGDATSLNFQFAKLSRIIHSPDQTPNMQQRDVGDIQFAKRFYDVHLPDQTPMSDPDAAFRTGAAANR
jgi:hypothetical protein